MTSFRDIKAWQRARELAGKVYAATKSFPPKEKYGLVSQLRRASVSIVANIAEGSKRASSEDFARFVNMAEGSASEVEALVFLSHDFGFLVDEERTILLSMVDEVQRMLHAFRRSLRRPDSPSLSEPFDSPELRR